MHNNFPNNFYFINSFNKNNIDNLENNTGVIYRSYRKKINLKDVIEIKNYCFQRKIKFYLSNNFKLALKLNLNGAYIPSFNKNFSHLNYSVKKSFIILGSAHNIKEIRQKERQNVRLIFISSLFRKNKNYLGIYKFMNLKKYSKKKIIALGGISKENLKKVKLLDCEGFSSISYFETKKKAPKRGLLL
tara:strand:+ start:559 stop:1122 length:564 start_codon:yes stop_codon:yes gene_type:complete